MSDSVDARLKVLVGKINEARVQARALAKDDVLYMRELEKLLSDGVYGVQLLRMHLAPLPYPAGLTDQRKKEERNG